MTRQSKLLILMVAFCFLATSGVLALQKSDETVTCPVSGDEIKKSEAKGSCELDGKTYYFCCAECVDEFKKNPEKHIQKKTEMKEIYTCSMHPEVKSDKPGECPKCGMKLEKKMMPMEHMHGEEEKHEHMHGEKEEQEHKMHEKAEGKSCCAMMGMISAKDVEMNVENFKDGIAIKITSKNAEIVKEIQEMAAKMKAMCEQKENQKDEVKK